jgi:protein O-GlcNAc transferase
MRTTTVKLSPRKRRARLPADSTAARLRAFFEAQRRLRKGLCLLNAGVFAEAVDELSAAVAAHPRDGRATRQLIRALSGARRYREAAGVAADEQAQRPHAIDAIVRLALTQWKASAGEDAIRTLREGLAEHPESAELHFQLGTMLAACDQGEEAHLRFVQANTLDPEHVDALQALALSFGARGEVTEAVHHLARAQRYRPHDVRVALLLGRALQAARETGLEVSVRTEMPVTSNSPTAIEQLGRLIEQDPDFVEACLALEPGQVDAGAHELLVATLRRAIETNPQQPRYHYLIGKVLERMGQADEAIAATERAIEMDPRHIHALILLAELYCQTDRCADARQRLEEAVMHGAEYADLYFLLGNLYRDDGELQRARWAYEQALRINGDFARAREALAALAA